MRWNAAFPFPAWSTMRGVIDVARPLPPATVPSPCISVCKMDDLSGLCTGCQRTLDEIAVWGMLDDDERRAVWQAIRERRAMAGASPRDSERS